MMVLSLATTGLERDTVVASTHLTSANGSAYCKLLTSYDAKQAAANKALETPGAAKAAMETAVQESEAPKRPSYLASRLVTAEQLQVVVPGRQQALRRLAAANFNFGKLSKAQIASFEASSKIMEGASNKITAYDKNVCGVKD